MYSDIGNWFKSHDEGALAMAAGASGRNQLLWKTRIYRRVKARIAGRMSD
jgi:hypothetical protein